MSAYYSEWEPYAAQWLRNLISAGLIPPGDVDERSITEVQPDDLRGYTQAHFFGGLGGWPYALRLAGWADDRPVWTGSCPCQPFSVAGKGAGKDDPRHLWPDFFRLIEARRPAVVLGEQVAGAAGEDWFDGVATDLERVNYAARAVDIPAAAVDAPHIRQRLYWCAVEHAASLGRREGRPEHEFRRGRDAATGASRSGVALGDADFARLERRLTESECAGELPTWAAGMANPDESRRGWWAEYGERFAYGEDGRRAEDHGEPAGRGEDRDDVADADGRDAITERLQRSGINRLFPQDRRDSGDSGNAECTTFWAGAEWLSGADGKARRTFPGIRLLVDGVPARASKLRALGNAICAPLASEVVKALMDVLDNENMHGL